MDRIASVCAAGRNGPKGYCFACPLVWYEVQITCCYSTGCLFCTLSLLALSLISI